MASNVSSISQALADTANSIHIPRPAGVPNYHKDNIASLVAKGPANTGLPTPPNSISPNLSANSLAARARQEFGGSPPDQVDSDVELGDAVNDAKHSSGVGPNIPENGHGTITPALIARDFLPGIILGKGQVPVKDVINHLCKYLPGFADIPPAKARRIVGAALEGHVGGPEGNVEFEKTGWGRWNAKIRTQSLRTISEHRSAAGGLSNVAMKIPVNTTAHTRKPRRVSDGAWAAESSGSLPSDPGDNMETDVFHLDADSMSVDGDADHETQYSLAQKQYLVNTTYSDTDEEDWASMGPSSLRGTSYSTRGNMYKHSRTSRGSRTKSPMPGGSSRSLPAHHFNNSNHQHLRQPMNLDFTGIEANTQEREAIEALMRMGSA